MGLTFKGTIEEMRQLAKSKGGICWSKEYVNSKTKLWWECSKGHRWESSPLSVKNRNSWCPVCANNLPLGMKEMHRLAKEKKGKCLSKEYMNVKIKLLWECNKGHQFQSTPDNVKQGKWCLKCKKKNLKQTT